MFEANRRDPFRRTLSREDHLAAASYAQRILSEAGFDSLEAMLSLSPEEVVGKVAPDKRISISRAVRTMAEDLSHSPDSPYRYKSFCMHERAAALAPGDADHARALYLLHKVNVERGLWKDFSTRADHDAEMLREAKSALRAFENLLRATAAQAGSPEHLMKSKRWNEAKSLYGLMSENSCHLSRFIATFLADRKYIKKDIEPFVQKTAQYAALVCELHGLPGEIQALQIMGESMFPRIPPEGRERVARALRSLSLALRTVGKKDLAKEGEAVAARWAPNLKFDPKLPAKSDPETRTQNIRLSDAQLPQIETNATNRQLVQPQSASPVAAKSVPHSAQHQAQQTPSFTPQPSRASLPASEHNRLSIVEGFTFSDQREDWTKIIEPLPDSLWKGAVSDFAMKLRSSELLSLLNEMSPQFMNDIQIIAVGRDSLAVLYEQEGNQTVVNIGSDIRAFITCASAQATCELYANAISLTIPNRTKLRVLGKLFEHKAKKIGHSLGLGADHSTVVSYFKRIGAAALQAGSAKR